VVAVVIEIAVAAAGGITEVAVVAEKGAGAGVLDRSPIRSTVGNSPTMGNLSR
jgi:hypothetical protein